MRKIVIVALGLSLLAAACNKKTANSTQPAQTQPAQIVEQPAPETPITPAVPETSVTPKTYEIKMTDSGFTPTSLTIKKGDTVKFVNAGSVAHWPASAPHPTHTAYPEFDAKQSVAAGTSWSFTFAKLGAWKFHDHLNPSLFGSVTVQE